MYCAWALCGVGDVHIVFRHHWVSVWKVKAPSRACHVASVSRAENTSVGPDTRSWRPAEGRKPGKPPRGLQLQDQLLPPLCCDLRPSIARLSGALQQYQWLLWSWSRRRWLSWGVRVIIRLCGILLFYTSLRTFQMKVINVILSRTKAIPHILVFGTTFTRSKWLELCKNQQLFVYHCRF